MTRIQNTFSKLKEQGRSALVTYLAAGDPDMERSMEVFKSLPDAGADIIELGMPFSDPMADGPTIQLATQRALKSGANLKSTLKMVDDFRKSNTQTPLVLMGYFNPIYQYGCEAFVKEAERVGVDGLIIVDLPPEEDEELRVHTQKAGIDLIRLITPVTDEHRLKTLVQSASGFLYYVSITGVTGTASADNSAVGEHIKEIKTYTDLPVAVGFGIKTPDDARSFAEVADGIVVGSALVAEFEIEPEQAGIRILNKVQALKAAL